ncbi:MAG: hypothetical protein PHU06_12165 [Gallionella sp.]|nr:hypothetical protein [Gallionella sp.]MDD4960224.1 hypothetical protein [Gallionella sp.]
MSENSTIEKASWVAGIIGAIVAVISFNSPSKAEEKVSPPVAQPTLLPNEELKRPLKIGSCVLDS